MQRSLTGNRLASATTRFVAASSHGREPRLGLHRHAFDAVMTSHETRRTAGAEVGRYVLRDRRVLSIAPIRVLRTRFLRREPRLRWASAAGDGRVWAVPRVPAPWRD